MTPFQYQGELAALATAGCWTVCLVVFGIAGKKVGTLSVNLIRLAIGFCLLGIFCGLTREAHPAAPAWSVVAGRLPFPTDAERHTLKFLAYSGFIGFFLGDLFLFKGLVLIGPRLSALIMSLWPAIAAAISWVTLGETLSPLQLAGMCATLAGVVWVVLERGAKTPDEQSGVRLSGIFFGVLASCGQAVGLVLAKHGMRLSDGGMYDAFAATQIRIVPAILGFAALFAITHRWKNLARALHNKKAVGLISIGAFTGPFLGVGLSLVAIKYTETGVASTIMALVPVMVLPFAIIFYKEKISRRAIAGALLAVAGVAILTLGKPAKTPDTTPTEIPTSAPRVVAPERTDDGK